VKDFEKIALEIANLVKEKQLAYGDSFGKAKEIIKVLYPSGIPVEAYGDALTVVRVIDKLFRIATKKDAFGESPWKDVLGYALLSLAKEEDKKAEEPYWVSVEMGSTETGSRKYACSCSNDIGCPTKAKK